MARLAPLAFRPLGSVMRSAHGDFVPDNDLSQPTDVFRGSIARKLGMVTRGELRGPKFRRLFQDVYAPADLPVTHELRCRGAALIAPREAVLTGRSAATVRGVALARPYDPVEFVVPEKQRFGPVQGIHIRRTDVGSKESRPWHGVRIARARRIALDLVLRLSPRTRGWVRRLRTAVADLDSFRRSKLVRLRTLIKLFNSRRNRGIRLARTALWLSDTRAESPPESELRVVLYFAGYRPVPQYIVRKRRRYVARLDLALVKERIAVEYDGRWHLKPAQREFDRIRRKKIREAGWHVIVIDYERLESDVAGIVDEIRACQESIRSD